MDLSAELAARLVQLILPNLHREYPNKPAHVMSSDADARPPRELTPMFYGCFDWHSAVHSHWALVRLAARFADAEWADDVRAALAISFTAERARGELAYLAAPGRRRFELPYGMAWLLQLEAELAAAGPAFAAWRQVLEPLASRAASQLVDWATSLPIPIRSGEHSQSAFAIGLALDAAAITGRGDVADRLRARALALYRADTAAPIAYEPSAYDFLSPSLAEAELMSRVLKAGEFAVWFDGFLPRLPIRPATVPDRSDGKLVHLDGLNLSRAWMLRRIARALDNDRSYDLSRHADLHLAAGMLGVATEHYEGAHWLGTFALYALTV